jgi:hypothetical protein
MCVSACVQVGMCMCMCVCVCVCVCVCARACVFVCVSACARAFMCSVVCISVHVCVCVWVVVRAFTFNTTPFFPAHAALRSSNSVSILALRDASWMEGTSGVTTICESSDYNFTE